MRECVITALICNFPINIKLLAPFRSHVRSPRRKCSILFFFREKGRKLNFKLENSDQTRSDRFSRAFFFARAQHKCEKKSNSTLKQFQMWSSMIKTFFCFFVLSFKSVVPRTSSVVGAALSRYERCVDN